jgi:hypothetical protein
MGWVGLMRLSGPSTLAGVGPSSIQGETEAAALAEAFAGALAQPGWYVDFRSPSETFVVFPGRVFRYPRGDGRAHAQAHGRQLGVPEAQLDWPA